MLMWRLLRTLGTSLCVHASLPVVPVVTVPFSDMNVVSEVVCEFVAPGTSSLSRKRDASVALESETKMNIEGPFAKAAPGAQSTKVGLSDVRVDIDCNGTLGDRNFVSSAGVSQTKRKAQIRKDTERDAGVHALPRNGSR